MYSKMNSILLWKKLIVAVYFSTNRLLFLIVYLQLLKKVHCKKFMCNKRSVFLKGPITIWNKLKSKLRIHNIYI